MQNPRWLWLAGDIFIIAFFNSEMHSGFPHVTAFVPGGHGPPHITHRFNDTRFPDLISAILSRFAV